jgi:hypothetical protein
MVSFLGKKEAMKRVENCGDNLVEWHRAALNILIEKVKLEVGA